MTTSTRWDEIHIRRTMAEHADRIHEATRPEVPDAIDEVLSTSREYAEQLVRWARWITVEAEQLRETAIQEARVDGVTWEELGAIHGVSRQAAWERWHHLEPPA